MRIRHENTAAGDLLAVGDDTYTADEHGWFDVPHDLGSIQSRFVGWRQDLGEEIAKVEHAAETVAADVHADLAEEYEAAVKRIKELEAELSAVKAEKTEPAKKAPAAKKAAAKDETPSA